MDVDAMRELPSSKPAQGVIGYHCHSRCVYAHIVCWMAIHSFIHLKALRRRRLPHSQIADFLRSRRGTPTTGLTSSNISALNRESALRCRGHQCSARPPFRLPSAD